MTGLSDSGAHSVAEVPAEVAWNLYLSMLTIRQFEERVAELLEQQEIRCPTHLCIGQEAVAAGVCAALGQADLIFGNHRSHGHYIAKGGDLTKLMAELFGRATGCSHGRGGSMHLVARDVGLVGTVPLVSGTIPLAVGTAMASKLRGDHRVSAAFFGDGAVEEGAFHESMNLAASMNLPIVFVCENNLYSSHLHILERRARDNIVQSAEAHGMVGVRLDGNDAMEVYQASLEAVGRARASQGPTLLECRTYRWRGHVGPAWDLDVGVKRRVDLSHWMAEDPVARMQDRLIAAGVPAAELENALRDVQGHVEEAVAFARESPYPSESEDSHQVFLDAADGGA